MRPPYRKLAAPGGCHDVACGRKFCSGCGRWRHVIDFGHVRGKGLRARCRVCFNRRTATRGHRSLFLRREPLVAELERRDDQLKEIARNAGIAERQIFRLRTGESRTVRLDIADRLAIALGLTLELIYDGEPTMCPQVKR